MKITSAALLLAVMAVGAFATTALAMDYTVGGSYGWDTYVDYDKWASGKTFMVGDTITFKYEPYHNVLEVTEANYDSCTADTAISTHSGGETSFELTATGTRYFICGIPRHCLNGTMHVKVTTVTYSAAAAAGPSPAPLPADSYADKNAPAPSLMDAAARSPAAVPSAAASAQWFQQPAAAVAGLAAAALLALAA